MTRFPPENIEQLKEILNNKCPGCRKGSEIISYLPIIKDGILKVEIECENCGYYFVLEAKEFEIKEK
jgi:hypothetical protein